MTEHELGVRQDEITWTPTDDGTVVILDLRTSRYLSVNSSATVLWNRLIDGASVETLTSELERAFQLSPTVAAADVEIFLDQLRSRDLLVEGP